MTALNKYIVEVVDGLLILPEGNSMLHTKTDNASYFFLTSSQFISVIRFNGPLVHTLLRIVH